MSVEELNDFRSKVLQLHYELSGGDPIHEASRIDVAAKVGFEDYNDDKLLAQIMYLQHAGFLKSGSNIGHRITVEGINEVEQDFPTLKPKPPATRFPQISSWRPNELEQRMLRAVQADYTENDQKKHVDAEIFELVEEAYPEQYTQDEIEQSFAILVTKRYFSKETITTPNARLTSRSTARQRVTFPKSFKTVYYSLTGTAYLYLSGRMDSDEASEPAVKAFTNDSPYSIRRLFEELFSNAKTQIRIIDNYVGRKTLDYLMAANENGTPIKIITSDWKEPDFDAALADFTKEYKAVVDLHRKPGVFHGRVIIVDGKCHIIDHSIKDFGKKPSSINAVEEPAVNDFYIKLFEDNWS